MSETLSAAALEQLFLGARTHNTFLPQPVPEQLLRQVYAIARMGPTSANCQPARIVFVQSAAGKAKLKTALSEGNRDKTLAAPVTAIVATDLKFYEKYPYVFPHNLEARSWFEGKPKHSETTALRNGTLQGAYLILAARAMGLACGPMSGFSNAKLDEAFFAGTSIKSNFLINLGFRNPEETWFPRSPRLHFDEACRIE